MTIRTALLVLFGLILVVSGGAASAEGGDNSRAVLVTGASSGIGLSITEVLAGNGFYVYAGARKKADLERLVAQENVSSVRFDVTVDEDIERAVAFVISQGSDLGGLSMTPVWRAMPRYNPERSPTSG